MNRLSSLLFALVLSPPLFAHQVTRASVSSEELQANAESMNPSISGNGRYIAFSSLASNLVPGDTNGLRDVFVRDLELGTTERVAEDADYPSISGDGRYVVYGDIQQRFLYLFDQQTGITETIAIGRIPHISDDGRRMAWELDNAGVFAMNLQDGFTWVVLLSSVYTAEPSISRSGRYVGFHSLDSNIVANDTNGTSDAFVYDLRANRIDRVSVSTTGEQGNDGSNTVTVTDGGEAIFQSRATNIVPGYAPLINDYFVHDLETGITEPLLSENGNGDLNWPPVVSSDGRYVAFDSTSSNLVPGADGWQIYVYDRLLGVTTWASRGPRPVAYHWWTARPSISADGSRVAFFSDSRKLVRRDTNAALDVFVWQQ